MAKSIKSNAAQAIRMLPMVLIPLLSSPAQINCSPTEDSDKFYRERSAMRLKDLFRRAKEGDKLEKERALTELLRYSVLRLTKDDISILQALAHDDNRKVADEAAAALSRVSGEAAELKDAILGLLEDSSAKVQSAAMSICVRLDIKEAAPKILVLLRISSFFTSMAPSDDMTT